MPRKAKLKRAAKQLPGKRYPLNMRTTHELRLNLERYARASGRSLVQEVEFRLEKSFLYEEMAFFLGEAPDETADLLRLILACVTSTEFKYRHKSWRDDPAVAQHLSELLQIVTAAFLTGKDVTPLQDITAELQAAMKGAKRHVSPTRANAWAILLNYGLVLAPDPQSGHPKDQQS
jgi:hypothetical protein